MGSRRRWQKQPGQSQSEPAIQAGRQAGSQSLQWSPSSSLEEPIIQERYQTMNHLRQSSPPLPSFTLSHSPDARPAACLPLSASLMNDYCILLAWHTVIKVLLIPSAVAPRWTEMFFGFPFHTFFFFAMLDRKSLSMNSRQ